DGSGLDVLKRVKEDPDRSDVIVFTGSDPMYRSHCLRAGAGWFITKEEGLEPLRKAIRAIAGTRELLSMLIFDETDPRIFDRLLAELRRCGYEPRWRAVSKQQELLDELKTGADVVFWWRPSGRIDLSRLLAAPNQRAPLVVIHDANRSDASAVALAEDA